MSNQYYAVFYTNDGSIHLIPADSQDDAETTIRNVLAKPRGKEVCKETAIIKRNLDNYLGGYIFGTRGLNIADAIPASTSPAKSASAAITDTNKTTTSSRK